MLTRQNLLFDEKNILICESMSPTSPAFNNSKTEQLRHMVMTIQTSFSPSPNFDRKTVSFENLNSMMERREGVTFIFHP